MATLGVAQQSPPPKAQAVVFTIAGVPTPSDGFAARACPKNVAALPTEEMEDAQKVVHAISREMVTAPSQHNMAAAKPAAPNQGVTPATLVPIGCLKILKRSSATARSLTGRHIWA